MSFYPAKINERLAIVRKAKRLEAANAVGTNASFVCGSALRFILRIEKQKIVEAKFQTNGCGYLMAAADCLLELITGKELSQLHGLENLENELQQKLEIFPANRRHCLSLAIETLQATFNDFRSAQLEEFVGEKALICTCFGVSEETIERIINENHCETVEEVSAKCNAGAGCGSCQPLIQEIIDSNSDML